MSYTLTLPSLALPEPLLAAFTISTAHFAFRTTASATLGKEILEYILEVAVIHLDRQDADYQVTVDDLAECFSKTPKQILPVLLRLAEAGYVHIDPPKANGQSFAPDDRVLPTTSTLRMLPTYADVPELQVIAEFSRLTL